LHHKLSRNENMYAHEHLILGRHYQKWKTGNLPGDHRLRIGD